MRMNPVLQDVNAGIRQLQPYQPGRPLAEVMRESGIEKVIKLASNENPLGSGELALTALRALTSELLALYPDSNAAALRRAISRRLSVAEDNIILGNGSNEILELAALLMLEEGSGAVYSDHAFIVYKLAVATRRASACSVAADNFSHDLSAMAAAANVPGVRLMFIANPNNPTGTWHPPAAIQALLKKTPPHVLVVLDEAYCDYTDTPDAALELLNDFPNLLITRTFSKIHGLAGLRAGYGIAHSEVAAMLNRIRQPFNMNIAAQLAATAAIDDTQHIEKSLRLNSEQIKILTETLHKLHIDFIPSYANFLTFRAPVSDDKLYEEMLANGLIIRKLHEYTMAGWLRVTIGLPEQNEKFIQLLKQFC